MLKDTHLGKKTIRREGCDPRSRQDQGKGQEGGIWVASRYKDVHFIIIRLYICLCGLLYHISQFFLQNCGFTKEQTDCAKLHVQCCRRKSPVTELQAATGLPPHSSSPTCVASGVVTQSWQGCCLLAAKCSHNLASMKTYLTYTEDWFIKGVARWLFFYETKLFSRKLFSHKSHINIYQKIFKSPIGFDPYFFSPAIATKITETKYLLFSAAWNLIPKDLVSRLIYCRTKYSRFQAEDTFSAYTGCRNPW